MQVFWQVLLAWVFNGYSECMLQYACLALEFSTNDQLMTSLHPGTGYVIYKLVCLRMRKLDLHAAVAVAEVFLGLLTAAPYTAGACLPSTVPAA